MRKCLMCKEEACSRLLQSAALYGIRIVHVSSGWFTDEEVAVCGSCICFQWRDAYRLEVDRDAPKERSGWEAMAWNAANLAVYEKFYDELPDTVRVQADRVLTLPALHRIESCWYRGKICP